MSETMRELENNLYSSQPVNEVQDKIDAIRNSKESVLESCFDTAVKMAYASKQVGGKHYAKHIIQPWNIIDEYKLDYYLGNVVKYILRDKDNQIEDLEKAVHYLEKKIELLSDNS